jgi:hydroxypyruvate reductase
MAAGACDVPGAHALRGLVVAPDGTPLDALGPCDHVPRSSRASREAASRGGALDVLRAAHPVPDARSEAAGRALLALAGSVASDEVLLVLLSGGASALAAVPRDGLTLEEKVAQVQALARRGAPIEELNRLRASLSQLKGGRLARACPSPVITLGVSDGPGDDLAVVGSGPTWPPREGDLVELVAGLGRVRLEAAAAARADGWDVVEREAPLVGEVEHVALAVMEAADALPEGGAWIAGGEWTVALPAHPGRGGRAAQLALMVARALGDPAPRRGLRSGPGRASGVRVLVGASDGIDGTGPEAGAIVDGDTWSRVALAGVDPEDALARCDAGPALAAIGAGLAGGPTGVNHADLVVVVRERRGSHEHP